MNVLVVLAARNSGSHGTGAVEPRPAVPYRARSTAPSGSSTRATTFTSPPAAIRTAARSRLNSPAE
ncbi:hypothetical protein [Streptomyces murinus]|uniref:hypothetical protein n=1 Tax=Streptomyces murinus TaxID=33900 RepID=UPI0036EDCF7E